MAIPTELVGGAQQAIVRLTAATVIGAAVGINRELRGKPAGLRTHALVSLGAALVTLSTMVLATDGSRVDANPVSRVVQGMVAGIGFLGGGVIIKASERGTVRNLTTAASLWVVACLGIACGLGQWALSLTAVTLTLMVLIAGGPFEDWLRRLMRKRRRPAGRAPADRRPWHGRETGEHRARDKDDVL
jgi:putative Mg2+ transporter-C (MgtC) family protein